MTLLEVLVAMAILGTLLATAVTARSRYVRQAARASLKRTAVAVADRTLAEWSSDWAAQGTDADGPVAGEPRLSWHRRLLERPDARELGARVLRLEVRESGTGGPPDGAAGGDPLATVEVLVPPDPKTYPPRRP